MEKKEKILKYIKDKYNPISIFVYGSFNKGTNNQNSDFDSLIIVNEKVTSYDNTMISNTYLDLFIYTLEEIEQLQNLQNFVHLYNASLVLDNQNIGKNFLEKIKKYVDLNSLKSLEEKEHLSIWIDKMLERIKVKDTEGMYRYHWLIMDSLELYCIFRDKFFEGSKDTIEYLEKYDKIGYKLFCTSLKNFDIDTLEKWCLYVKIN